jgi:hypothetical protein
MVGVPLQKHDSRPVERPPGMVPPPVDVPGVTELRVHGVGGTTPESLLVDAAPQLVSGNRIAAFFRTADRAGRHVEAYSWGGLTSRSASRVLWLLLFPFALANLAGWMCSPTVWASKWRFYLHRAVVRWAALGMTVNLLLLVAMTTMDVGAYQCGARPQCVDHWWLRWLRLGALADHPTQRVLAGAAVPLLLIVGLMALAGRSLSRYEQVDPPRKLDDPDRLDACTATLARPKVGLADKDFWNGKRSVGDLALVHVGAALAFLGWLVHYTVRAIPLESGAALTAPGLDVAAAVLAVVALAMAAMLLTRGTISRGPAWSVVALGLLALVCAVVLALVQPAASGVAPSQLPGMRMAANWTYAFCIVAAVAVLPAHCLGGWRKGGFFAGPFVATAIGVILLNGVGIGTMIRIADLLGNVANPGPGAGAGRPPNSLYVYDAVYAVTPCLTVLPTAILLLFALVEGFTLWHAARPSQCKQILDDYGKLARPDPPTPWDRSVLADEGKRLDKLAKAGTPARLWHDLRRPGWAARTARGRRLASIPRDADKLLAFIAFVALGVLAWFWYRFLAYHDVPRTWPWLLTVSTWLAAALPLAVLLLMRQGWRGLDSRRHIGVLWDVGTFWPRAYHPLAPPSYAERAVPDLQRRLWYLREHQGAAVIAAHSQGSVIAVAALLQERRRPGDDNVGLVTFGCPLTKLYGWAFPAYFGQQALTEPGPRVWSWRNFFYDTDYIGGRIMAASSRLDTRLEDPPTFWYLYGQDPPAPGRHSAYWNDPQVWAMVDQYAKTIPVPPASPPPDERMAAENMPSEQLQPYGGE